MNYSAMRDRVIGRRIARCGSQALKQAKDGGSAMDNIVRTQEWRNRYMTIPIEITLPKEKK